MTLTEFKRLKDLLMRAAATNSDAELVQSFRRATILLSTHNWTWAQALDKVIIIVNEVEAEPPSDDELEQLFEDAKEDATGSFLVLLEDIYAQFQRSGRISDKQRKVITDAAERYHKRQSRR